VRDYDLLEADFEAQLAEFGGDVFGGSRRLRRTCGASSNVFGEVSELAVGVVVIERGGFDGGKLLEEEWREIMLRGLRGLWS
jgi:hypothetical protein